VASGKGEGKGKGSWFHPKLDHGSPFENTTIWFYYKTVFFCKSMQAVEDVSWLEIGTWK
jgi:hypothetical protein